MSVTIYHNPACGTSRNTLAMIRQSGVEPEVIEYLKNPPSRLRLIELISGKYDYLPPPTLPPTPADGPSRMSRHGVSGDGRYVLFTANAPSLGSYADALYLRDRRTSETRLLLAGPTRDAADKLLAKAANDGYKMRDANDVLYAVEASYDYDPGPGLGKIQAPLLAINFADDLINPPELGILEREIRRVARGEAVLVPRSDRTRGHGTHTLAAVWKARLRELLERSEGR